MDAAYGGKTEFVDGWQPDVVDKVTLAGNQVSWALVREAGRKLIEENGKKRR